VSNPYQLETFADVCRLMSAFGGEHDHAQPFPTVGNGWVIWRFKSWQEAAKAETILGILTDKCSRGPVEKYEYDSLHTTLSLLVKYDGVKGDDALTDLHMQRKMALYAIAKNEVIVNWLNLRDPKLLEQIQKAL